MYHGVTTNHKIDNIHKRQRIVFCKITDFSAITKDFTIKTELFYLTVEGE
jgi:hypothetical protein